VHEEVAQFLQNRKRKDIVALEESGSKKRDDPQRRRRGVAGNHLEFLCYDSNGNEVKFTSHDEPPPRPSRRR